MLLKMQVTKQEASLLRAVLREKATRRRRLEAMKREKEKQLNLPGVFRQ